MGKASSLSAPEVESIARMTNRRDFLNLMGLGIAGMASRSWLSAAAPAQEVDADTLDADLVVFRTDLAVC